MVGYVGVMGEQEGIDLLLRAAAELVRRGRTDVQFCLVGGGPSLASLKTLSSDLGVDPFITFTGSAHDQTLFEILSTADVCVNPDPVNAMNDKSTMNKILEYMAMGKPIVQFEVTEGRYSAGEASVFAKPNDVDDLADKIERLLDSPAERDRMGRVGRARVEGELSWARQSARLIEAYERLFNPERGDGARSEDARRG